MNATPFLPPGRAIPAVPPRPDALAAIATGVSARRRRNRNRAIAGAVLALLAATPLLLTARDHTTGLEPARPGPTPSRTPASAWPADGALSLATAVTGVAADLTPAPAATPSACDCAARALQPPESSGTLTITGSRTGYATVLVDRTTTVDVAAASADYLGDYAGFAIGDAEVLYVRAMEGTVPPTPAYRRVESVMLWPGTYRVYLFTPTGSATTVTLPWSGQPSRTVGPDVAVAHEFEPEHKFLDDDQSGGRGISKGVTLVAATFGPATTGVTLSGCLSRIGEQGPCVTAHSTGASVGFVDRLTSVWAGWSYTFRVRGDRASAAGLLRAAMFRYERG